MMDVLFLGIESGIYLGGGTTSFSFSGAFCCTYLAGGVMLSFPFFFGGGKGKLPSLSTDIIQHRQEGSQGLGLERYWALDIFRIFVVWDMYLDRYFRNYFLIH